MEINIENMQAEDMQTYADNKGKALEAEYSPEKLEVLIKNGGKAE